MTVVRVDEDDERFADARAVRVAVFVEEQDVPEALEFDEHDADARHFVAYDDENGTGERDGGERGIDESDDGGNGRSEAVGVARLRESESGDGERVGKVERVAVREARRGEGWGDALMDAVEAAARDAGYDVLELHAQTHARGFYARRGYAVEGEPFDEAGIPHVHMVRRLDD